MWGLKVPKDPMQSRPFFGSAMQPQAGFEEKDLEG